MQVYEESMADSANPTGSAVQNDGSQSLVTYRGDENVLSAVDGTKWGENSTGPTRLVWVTTEGTPDEVVTELRNADMTGMPNSVDVISIGDVARAATATSGTPSTTVVPFEPCDLTVHGLRRGSDVDEIARSVMECLEHVARGDQEIIFDNLNQLVSDTSLEDVYQLLHLLTGKASIEGWTVSVGVNLDNVDERVVQTLEPLFDDVY